MPLYGDSQNSPHPSQPPYYARSLSPRIVRYQPVDRSHSGLTHFLSHNSANTNRHFCGIAYSGLSPVKRSTFSRILSAKAFARSVSMSVSKTPNSSPPTRAKRSSGRMLFPMIFTTVLSPDRQPDAPVSLTFEVVDIHNHDAIRRFWLMLIELSVH